MKKYLISSLLLFIIVAIDSGLSRHFHLYSAYWFTDVILHTVSGIAFGCLWIGLHKKNSTPVWFTLAVGAISFATFGSVLWEFWEFAGWRLTPAQVPFYIPQLGDTLGDIFCGLIGGMLSSLSLLFRHKKENA